MPLIAGLAIAGIVGITGSFKLVTSGIDDLSDSSLKMAGAAVLGITAYVAAKRVGLI